jgi:ribonuclease HI
VKQDKETAMVQTRWQASEPDVIKFNFDGAFKRGHDHAGWGVLARDHQGDVVAAVAGQTENVAHAFRAEVCAAGQAICLVESLGTIHIVLEIDSELLMLAMNRRGANLSLVGVAISSYVVIS